MMSASGPHAGPAPVSAGAQHARVEGLGFRVTQGPVAAGAQHAVAVMVHRCAMRKRCGSEWAAAALDGGCAQGGSGGK